MSLDRTAYPGELSWIQTLGKHRSRLAKAKESLNCNAYIGPSVVFECEHIGRKVYTTEMFIMLVAASVTKIERVYSTCMVFSCFTESVYCFLKHNTD